MVPYRDIGLEMTYKRKNIRVQVMCNDKYKQDEDSFS